MIMGIFIWLFVLACIGGYMLIGFVNARVQLPRMWAHAIKETDEYNNRYGPNHKQRDPGRMVRTDFWTSFWFWWLDLWIMTYQHFVGGMFKKADPRTAPAAIAYARQRAAELEQELNRESLEPAMPPRRYVILDAHGDRQ